TRRHDKILDAIISCFANSEMKGHKTPRIYHDNQDYLIPDLLLVSPSNKTAYCLDVGVSYELVINQTGSLDNYDRHKREKYERIRDHIIAWIKNQGDEHVDDLKTYGLIFGSRGSIHNVALNLLSDIFSIPYGSIEDMLLKCVLDSHEMVLKYRSWGLA